MMRLTTTTTTWHRRHRVILFVLLYMSPILLIASATSNNAPSTISAPSPAVEQYLADIHRTRQNQNEEEVNDEEVITQTLEEDPEVSPPSPDDATQIQETSSISVASSNENFEAERETDIATDQGRINATSVTPFDPHKSKVLERARKLVLLAGGGSVPPPSQILPLARRTIGHATATAMVFGKTTFQKPWHSVQEIWQAATQLEAKERRSMNFAALMAFSGGFLDVRALQRFGCFLNMCTGNTIRAVSSFSQGGWETLDRVSASVVMGYVLGVALARVAKREVELQIFATRELEDPLYLRSSKKKDDMATAVATRLENSTSVLPPWHRVLLLPTNKNHTSSSLVNAVVAAIPPLFVIFFVLADMITMTYPRLKSWQAVAQAIGYGILHTVASDALDGCLLFTVTGHWANLSTSIMEQQTKTIAKQIRILGAFMAGVFAGMVFLKDIAQWLPCSNSCFPIHTLTGLYFAAIFLWYGNPQ